MGINDKDELLLCLEELLRWTRAHTPEQGLAQGHPIAWATEIAKKHKPIEWANVPTHYIPAYRLD